MTRRRPPAARMVITATLALFLVVFALLAFQLRNGRDPALGAGAVAHASAPPPKRVLVRKLIVTRVIVHLPAEDAPAQAARTVTVPAAPAAPSAPAPIPAPAAAPAPLTTHSS
jgi:hypothetical protein